MWFDSWSDLTRILLIGPSAYVALVLMLRITGGRTLAQLNAFDMIVTVALGSVLATILLSSTVSYSEGVLALAVLVALQYVVTWASTRARFVQDAVRNEPALLYSGGFLHDRMRRERVTQDELRQVARSQGHASLEEDVRAVVLETDGTFSVLTSAPTSLDVPPEPAQP